MRWQTKHYDFRFKGTPTAGIGIHPTRAWLSQLVNFKNAIWTWGHFRRTICNNEKRDKYLDFTREIKKLCNMEVIVIPIVISVLRTVLKSLGEKSKVGDRPNYSIDEIGQNTDKNPRGQRRIGVPQTPVKDHQQALVWKIERNNNPIY